MKDVLDYSYTMFYVFQDGVGARNAGNNTPLTRRIKIQSCKP
jgi:hypothetical protein